MHQIGCHACDCVVVRFGFYISSFFQVPVLAAGRSIKVDGQEHPDESSGSSSPMLKVLAHVVSVPCSACVDHCFLFLICVCVC